MSIFKKKKQGGVSDVIRCDEKDYLVWKWHPDKYSQGSLKRENAIRTNSVLRVKNGELAVFVYNRNNGNNEDYILGPYDETIKTKNFPVLSSIIGLWYETDTPFQAEIYFINLSQTIQIKFGVSYFDVVDPRYPDFAVPLAVRGTLTFKIEDYKGFVKAYRLSEFSLDDFKEKLRDGINRIVKNEIANVIVEHNIPIVSIESKMELVNNKIDNKIKMQLSDDFKVSIVRFDIGAIDIDYDSEGYIELKKITKDITIKKAGIDILNYEERLRIQREEGQYAQHMATRTANLSAYQTEAKEHVGVAGAEALGKMGENGVGNVDVGGSSFNPMTMMAGIAVGSAVGKNIAGIYDQTVNNNGVPPTIPQIVYYIAKDNVPGGPYDKNKVIEMITSGQVQRDSLVWKQGTPTWEKAESFSEFATLFPPEMP